MKKYLVIILLIVPCLALSSLDIGLGAEMSLVIDTEKVDSSSASLTEVQLTPGLHLMISPQIEINPFVAVGIHKESDPDDIVNLAALYPEDWAEDYSQLWFFGGCGFYYHFINREIVSLSTGPRLALFLFLPPSGTSAPVFDSYFNLGVGVALPIFFDVKLKQWLILRTGLEALNAQFNIVKTEQGGGTYSSTDFTIQDYFFGEVGGLQAYVGLIFMF